MGVRRSHAAPGPMAGYLFQVERALVHLAESGNNKEVVAVELLDDVAVIDGDEVRIREQAKHSIARAPRQITLRSLELWKTLDIWLRDATPASRYFLTTTRPVAPAFSVLDQPGGHVSFAKKLRAEGGALTKSRSIQAVSDVLAHKDDRIKDILSRLTVLVISQADRTLHDTLTARLGIPDGVDRDMVIDRLFGWVTQSLLSAWRAGQPGKIARRAFINQCRAIESSVSRARILPRPSTDVPVTPGERAAAVRRRFVQHLETIEADDDDITDAVRFFVQFNTEMHRLVELGDIPDAEWDARGARLEQRWQLILRKTKRENQDQPSTQIGAKVLSATTYEHLEPLDGNPCHELYMTAGHYHRLADVDRVWWCPLHQRRGGKRRAG